LRGVAIELRGGYDDAGVLGSKLGEVVRESLGVWVRGRGVQGIRGSGVQGFRGSGVQGLGISKLVN
jgi:hypothetical protein